MNKKQALHQIDTAELFSFSTYNAATFANAANGLRHIPHHVGQRVGLLVGQRVGERNVLDGGLSDIAAIFP